MRKILVRGAQPPYPCSQLRKIAECRAQRQVGCSLLSFKGGKIWAWGVDIVFSGLVVSFYSRVT